MRFLSAFLGFTFLLMAVCFAVTNRQIATVSLWPFDIQIDAPVYLLTLGCLFTGLLAGALITWVSLLPHHLATRRLHKEMARMNEKIAELHHSVQAAVPHKPIPLLSPKRGWRFWSRGR